MERQLVSIRTKINIVSDLHLDTYKTVFGTTYPNIINRNNADILIIAGDLCEYNNIHLYKSFLQDVCDSYKEVLYVPGNHEYYNSHLNVKFNMFPDNMIVLNNTTYVKNGIAFYGGTMWASLENMQQKYIDILPNMVNCFNMIEDLTIDKCISMYNKFIEGLYEFDLERYNKKVVISHFSPSEISTSKRFENSPINPYFSNDIDKFIETSSIDLFVHGHLHNNVDYHIGKSRIICNPRGYPNEKFDLYGYTYKTVII